jgi:phosphoribosylanthranilate isomerase
MTQRLPFVKICCISSVDEAHLAIAHGASALGLVSAMPSGPGVIDDSLIGEIAASVPPPIATFLLTAMVEAPAIIEQHRRCRTTTIQLVDHVELAELRTLRLQLPGIKLVQVIHVYDAAALKQAKMVAPFVDALLLDSGNPSLVVKELGGTGRTHDWQLSRRIRDECGLPLYLAGGLNASNVTEAINTVQPFGLDLCSSVRENDKLSSNKLAAFMAQIAESGS